MPPLTSGEGLSQDLGREGGLGAALLLEELLAQDVSPAAVEEAVEDVGGDHLGQREPRGLQPGLEDQGFGGQHRAHHGGEAAGGPGSAGRGRRAGLRAARWLPPGYI